MLKKRPGGSQLCRRIFRGPRWGSGCTHGSAPRPGGSLLRPHTHGPRTRPAQKKASCSGGEPKKRLPLSQEADMRFFFDLRKERAGAFRKPRALRYTGQPAAFRASRSAWVRPRRIWQRARVTRVWVSWRVFKRSAKASAAVNWKRQFSSAPPDPPPRPGSWRALFGTGSKAGRRG